MQPCRPGVPLVIGARPHGHSVLGLIPARGGSKGIPHKNITPLRGRPLLAYTCEAALASRYLDRVVLSTDDEAIAEAGRSCGVEVPFLRPSDLARDETPAAPVVRHALQQLRAQNGWQPDVVVLLQPTSPLRRTRHIDEALELLERTGADTVVSVVEVPHRFHPYSVMRVEEGLLRDFWETPLPFDRYRRQELPRLFGRNGPAVLATRVGVVRDSQGLYGERVVPYPMSEEHSIDIDTASDVWLAECLLERLSSVPDNETTR